jgi:hypothetical protein
MRSEPSILLVAICVFTLGACAALQAATPVACAIVSTLNSACMLLTFTGADGKPHTVSCTRTELDAWGQVVEARHAVGKSFKVEGE